MSFRGSKQPLIDSSDEVKKGNANKWPELKTYFYDQDTKEVLGRDDTSWAHVALFYLAFYGALLVLVTILVGFLALIIDEIKPTHIGKESLLKNDPGLSMRPVADFESTLIRFIQGKPSTYKSFADHIGTFLHEYENEAQDGENFIDCSLGRPPDMEDKVCRFNVDDLGDDCIRQRDFGYDDGKPCVLIKLNKIYNWRPEMYETIDEVPDEIKPYWHPDYIGITCNGRYDQDYENIGNLTYWPSAGFPRHYYPFLNQEGYRSPLVMMKFDNAVNGVVINVECKAWAKNIRQHTNDRIGVITFEIMID